MSFEPRPTTPDAHTEGGITLAVVVEGHRLAAGLVDGSGAIVVRDRIATPAHDVWRSLEALISRVLAAAPSATPRPRALGVTCGTPIDTRAGSVSPSFIPAWNNFPLRERLNEFTEIPTVLDSLAGAAAEARVARSETPPTDFIEVILGSSVNSACVVTASRLRGAHGNAGSIAHITVQPGGNPCWCGSLGCTEAYVSTSSIEADIKRPLARATPATMEQTGIMLGRALSSIAVTVDVSTAFLSGSLLDVFGEPMLSAARAEIEIRSRLDNVAGLTIHAVSSIPTLVAAAAIAHHDDKRSTAVTGG